MTPARDTTADVIMPSPRPSESSLSIRPQAEYADHRDNAGNYYRDQLSTLVFSGHCLVLHFDSRGRLYRNWFSNS